MQRSERDSRCQNVGMWEGVFQHRSESAGVLGETALPGFYGSSDRCFNRRITDDPPYQAGSVQSAPTLVGALPVLWFGVRVPRITRLRPRRRPRRRSGQVGAGRGRDADAP